MVRDSREAFKTRDDVFDNFTERLLFKLSGQGHFDQLSRIISPGKEAVVFVAAKGEEKVAVKIYKLETAKFTKMYSYIRVDPRYHALKNSQRQVIFSWTEREYRNLLICRQAGVRAPMPITHRFNVLVMEFIGDAQPAPLLKASPPEDPAAFAEMTFAELEKLVRAGFMHGDLSEHNILNHDEVPVLIDFSHMAPMSAPNSRELLERDVDNLCRYFTSLGVTCDRDAFIRKCLIK